MGNSRGHPLVSNYNCKRLDAGWCFVSSWCQYDCVLCPIWLSVLLVSLLFGLHYDFDFFLFCVIFVKYISYVISYSVRYKEKPRTRSDYMRPVFGESETCKDYLLPTYAGMIRYYLYIREELLGKINCLHWWVFALKKILNAYVKKNIFLL